MFLDDGVGALLNVLEAYMGEATRPTKPTWGWTAWPPRTLANMGAQLLSMFWVVVMLLRQHEY